MTDCLIVTHTSTSACIHLQLRRHSRIHTNSQSTVARCLELDPSYSSAHLLMAQIALKQKNHRLANQSLEQALSYNFQSHSNTNLKPKSKLTLNRPSIIPCSLLSLCNPGTRPKPSLFAHSPVLASLPPSSRPSPLQPGRS